MNSRAVFERLDEGAVEALGRLFGAAATVEPYSPDGTAVYRIELSGAGDGISLVLWPSLERVDVTRAGDHSWVMKHVARLEVISGVEAVFRPRSGEGTLTVTVNGFVNMVMD